MRSASSAPTRRPVSRISAARPPPTMRGSRYVAPISDAAWPMFTWAATKNAEGSAIRMSAAIAIEKPPPAHGPFTAATTGWGSAGA